MTKRELLFTWLTVLGALAIGILIPAIWVHYGYPALAFVWEIFYVSLCYAGQ